MHATRTSGFESTGSGTGIHDEVVVQAYAQLAWVGGEAARDKNRAAERGGDEP